MSTLRKVLCAVSGKCGVRLVCVPGTCSKTSGMAMWSFPDCGSFVDIRAPGGLARGGWPHVRQL